MPSNLTNQFSVKDDYLHEFADALGTPKEKQALLRTTQFTFGNGANQANDLFRQRYTVSSGSPNVDLDLQALTNEGGESIVFTSVREVWVYNTETASGENLTIGAAAASPWTAPFSGSGTATSPCHAGSHWLVSSPVSGLAVTAGSKVLRIAHNGTVDITFDVFVLGVK